ncbi:serine carboxypeptidase [Favolaschia claudopus]|uniref:Serine carboxypeptidase n=1 Tax=Favolaschia claudopus TaxID=2862362 RepID=A0AAW0CGM0_9AGAR
MAQQITLYLAQICPAAHRVEIVLAEANVTNHTRYEIEIGPNKPKWFTEKVNPAGLVPAITYGGPKVSPNQPSPDSIKIGESLIISEFIADLYPACNLIPSDPVHRAKMRQFMDAVMTKYVAAYAGVLIHGKPFEELYTALEWLQNMLPSAENTAGFAVGSGEEFTLADVAVATLFARMLIWMKMDLGAFEEGEGRKAYAYLHDSGKFVRLLKQFEAVKARESWKKTYDEDMITEAYKIQLAAFRAGAA